jgi:hypothetical protein
LQCWPGRNFRLETSAAFDLPEKVREDLFNVTLKFSKFFCQGRGRAGLIIFLLFLLAPLYQPLLQSQIDGFWRFAAPSSFFSSFSQHPNAG